MRLSFLPRPSCHAEALRIRGSFLKVGSSAFSCSGSSIGDCTYLLRFGEPPSYIGKAVKLSALSCLTGCPTMVGDGHSIVKVGVRAPDYDYLSDNRLEL
jgi:hypothetical protein